MTPPLVKTTALTNDQWYKLGQQNKKIAKQLRDRARRKSKGFKTRSQSPHIDRTTSSVDDTTQYVLIIFDVDDTLSPTSSIVTDLYHDKDGEMEDNMDSSDYKFPEATPDQVEKLEKIDNACLALFERLFSIPEKNEDVSIEIALVTAAGEWGFRAVCHFLPKWASYLVEKDILVYVNHWAETDLDKTQYKTVVFENLVLNKIDVNRNSHVLSIGDGDQEKTAVFNVGADYLLRDGNIMQPGLLTCTAMKLRDDTDIGEDKELGPKQIQAQLENLSPWMDKYVKFVEEFASNMATAFDFTMLKDAPEDPPDATAPGEPVLPNRSATTTNAPNTRGVPDATAGAFSTDGLPTLISNGFFVVDVGEETGVPQYKLHGVRLVASERIDD